MFVEGEVEIKIKDRSAVGIDDHETKLWIQRSFKNMSCYRISDFTRADDRSVKATVAINTTVLPETERMMMENKPNASMMRSFIERMFDGKGQCRCVGEPRLKPN